MKELHWHNFMQVLWQTGKKNVFQFQTSHPPAPFLFINHNGSHIFRVIYLVLYLSQPSLMPKKVY